MLNLIRTKTSQQGQSQANWNLYYQFLFVSILEAYLGHCQTPMIELFLRE